VGIRLFAKKDEFWDGSNCLGSSLEGVMSLIHVKELRFENGRVVETKELPITTTQAENGYALSYEFLLESDFGLKSFSVLGEGGINAFLDYQTMLRKDNFELNQVKTLIRLMPGYGFLCWNFTVAD